MTIDIQVEQLQQPTRSGIPLMLYEINVLMSLCQKMLHCRNLHQKLQKCVPQYFLVQRHVLANCPYYMAEKLIVSALSSPNGKFLINEVQLIPMIQDSFTKTSSAKSPISVALLITKNLFNNQPVPKLIDQVCHHFFADPESK